ncbi:restriction endonuclease subunit S [Methylophaga sp.]|uniref:restriction endonuclease subunit S n=1 Tax=Methylophaga sp. TaxID=2024840 RepID=UPI0027193B85|nr:restriction endonuclease subunit S [Methylophaga sp.]MDO8827728.1 restriction endonuclease subunit S [Methylophaga sp.]
MSFMEKLLDGIEVEWKPISEVTLRTSNIRWRDAIRSYQYIDLTSVSIETKQITDTSVIAPNNAPSRAQKLVKKDDVIFATTRPTQMRYCLIGDEYNGEVASTGYCVLRVKKEEVLPKWILHLISSGEFKNYLEENQSGSAYPAISDAKVKEFQIPIPCPENPKKSLEIQAEIVRILDTFTELTAELTAELSMRKKQYNYYRDKLLTFEEGEVEWRALGDVTKIQRGASPRPISKYITEEQDGVPWIKIGDTIPGSKYVNGTAQRVTLEGAKKSRILNKGDFIMSNSMSFGRPYILGIKGAIHDGWASISDFGQKLNSDYLYHYLSSNKVQNYWTSKINSGSVSNLNADIIKTLPIPIPTLSRQKRIASILDKFDALTNSITEGLPREIELRQKQYEYYRDLLLSFQKPDEQAA